MTDHKTITNIDLLFSELFQLQQSGKYFFRGVSREAQFSPTLFREFNNKKTKLSKPEDVWNFEKALLKKYSQYSIQYLPAINFPLDWVASAQHFGIPTRLLDWTSNPFTGLFFAVFHNTKESIDNMNEDDYYRLLVVNKEDHLYFSQVPSFQYFITNSNTFISDIDLLDRFIFLTGVIGNKDIGDYNKNINVINKEFIGSLQDKKNKNKLLFCSIANSNPRIVAQEGLFLIPRNYGSGAGKGWIKSDIIDGCEIIFKFSKDFRKDILIRLENMGINTIRLFPDLQSICEYIKFTTDV